MAIPIPLELPARDPREELRVRLEHAPLEHAEALLAGLEVVQGLYDRGVLDLLRGVLGGSDKILEIVVDAVKTPEAIRAIRNLLILTKAFGSIDPDRLHAVMSGDSHDPSLWNIAKQATAKDGRRGMAAAVGLLNILGAALNKKEPGSPL